MATLAGFYLNRHRSQYEAGASAITRRAGCTWTSGSNGADASTAGAKKPSPDSVHSQVSKMEETASGTPGWSLADLKKALGRLSIPFDIRTGDGWSEVVAAWNRGLYVVLQGDSDQFGNDTCSGDFEGNHAVGVHPAYRIFNGLRQRWVDDTICGTGRWEYEYVLRRYAIKLWASIMFGVFLTPVKKVASSTSTYRIQIQKGASVQTAGFASSGCVNKWTNQKWNHSASGAPCQRPIVRRTCKSKVKVTLARVTEGAFKGKYVRISSKVTLSKRTVQR